MSIGEMVFLGSMCFIMLSLAGIFAVILFVNIDRWLDGLLKKKIKELLK